MKHSVWHYALAASPLAIYSLAVISVSYCLAGDIARSACFNEEILTGWTEIPVKGKTRGQILKEANEYRYEWARQPLITFSDKRVQTYPSTIVIAYEENGLKELLADMRACGGNIKSDHGVELHRIPAARNTTFLTISETDWLSGGRCKWELTVLIHLAHGFGRRM